MGKTLTEIAQQLSTFKTVKKTVPKEIEEVEPVPKVQIIYAFNGVGKTRLSREFKELIAPQNDSEEVQESELAQKKILYYNAFTEDLFYWDNDLEQDADPKLKIQPNLFTDWVLRVLIDQGLDRNITTNFQHYVNERLTPHFSEDYSEVSFSLERGDNENSSNLKISKGEESNFIWSIFYTLIELVITILKAEDPTNRETNVFDQLEYIFIDDPVSSLDENHLIQLAVDLAKLVKSNRSNVKFIITTHNPLFYNVLHNELNSDDGKYKKKGLNKYRMTKLDDGTYQLVEQRNDSPFSYHLYLKSEIEKAILSDQLSKYHFNFLRNILEKTSTFLGYEKWGDLLPQNDDGRAMMARIINISSHSKHAGEEVAVLTEEDKRVLRDLVNYLNTKYCFQQTQS